MVPAFSRGPGFVLHAFFVPDVGGGPGGGLLAGFGATVIQNDFGGPDNPVVALVPGFREIEVPRFHLRAILLPKKASPRAGPGIFSHRRPGTPPRPTAPPGVGSFAT